MVAYKSLLNVSRRAPNRLNRSLIYTKWRQSLDETLGSTLPLLRTPGEFRIIGWHHITVGGLGRLDK